jgi:hypothetical protein
MGIGFGVYAGLARSASWTRVAERAVYAVAALVSVAIGSLAAAFALCDFSIQYVAETSARAMPLPYRLAAVWGGQDGSLLLWLWILAAYSTAAVVTQRHRNRGLMPWVAAILLANQLFFLVLLNFFTNPFELFPPGQAPATPREPTGERSGDRGPRPREAVRPRARPARTELGGDRWRRAGGRRPQRRGQVHATAPVGGPGPAQPRRACRKCGEMTYVVIAYELVGGHLSAYGLHFFRERRSLPGAWQRLRRPIELDKSGAAEVQAISAASSTYGCGLPVPGVTLRSTPHGQVRVSAALSAIPCADAPVAPNSLAPADRVGSPLPKSGSRAPASPTAEPITGAQGARTFPLHQTVGTLETHGRVRSGTGLELLESAAVGRLAPRKATFRGELEWQRAWRA